MTSQPLLLYLTAWGRDQGFAFTEDFNLNRLYAFLLERIYERRWDRGTHAPTKQAFTLDEFVEALETAAVAAWHSEGRGATVGAVRRAHGGKLPDALRSLFDDEKAGLLRLLMAFYLRPRGFEDGEASFEFTHKSFREYLTARAIFRRLDEIVEDLEHDRRRPRQQYLLIDALADWAKLCGPTPIDFDLWRFLMNEAVIVGEERCRNIQTEVCAWISSTLRAGMPMERLSGEIATFGEMDRHARHAEGALLVVAGACASVSHRLQTIDWPDSFAAGLWLRRLNLQIETWAPTPVKHSLAFINLGGAHLTAADLYNAILSGADLEGALLLGANLDAAILEDVNLKSAYLRGARLRGSYLAGADLAGIHLLLADLADADVSSALNLSRAIELEHCLNLRRAHLSDEQQAWLVHRGLLQPSE